MHVEPLRLVDEYGAYFNLSMQSLVSSALASKRYQHHITEKGCASSSLAEMFGYLHVCLTAEKLLKGRLRYNILITRIRKGSLERPCKRQDLQSQ